ncbi:hypothetical protein B0H11DRAFT_2252623 [Mycena galericulata]|nr:hypothetical protein B0H11DRAFT_2252623 [Mycena galericulata]
MQDKNSTEANRAVTEVRRRPPEAQEEARGSPSFTSPPHCGDGRDGTCWCLPVASAASLEDHLPPLVKRPGPSEATHVVGVAIFWPDFAKMALGPNSMTPSRPTLIVPGLPRPRTLSAWRSSRRISRKWPWAKFDDPLPPHVNRPGPSEATHVVGAAIFWPDFAKMALGAKFDDPLPPHVMRPGPSQATHVVGVAIEPLVPHVMRQRAPPLCFFLPAAAADFAPPRLSHPPLKRVSIPLHSALCYALFQPPPPPPVSSPPPPFFLPAAAANLAPPRLSRPPQMWPPKCVLMPPHSAPRYTQFQHPRQFRTRRRRRRRFRPTAAFAPTADARVNTPTQRTVLHTIPAPPASFEPAAVFFARRRRRFCPTAQPPQLSRPPLAAQARVNIPTQCTVLCTISATATGFGPAAAAAFCPPPPPLSPHAAFTPTGDVAAQALVYNLFPTFNMPEDLQIFDDDDLHQTLKDELGLIRMVTKLNTVQGKGKGIVNILDIEEDDCVDD